MNDDVGEAEKCPIISEPYIINTQLLDISFVFGAQEECIQVDNICVNKKHKRIKLWCVWYV